MTDLLKHERELWQKGVNLVAGVDECGRGALAGPLLAAAVVLPQDFDHTGVRDSKCLTEEQREAVYPRILAQALAVSVAWISPRAIDEAIDTRRFDDSHRDLLRRVVEALHPQPDFVLVDHYLPDLKVKVLALENGEKHSASIAAASIVAKVTRDRTMVDFDRYLPHWGFARHKGYGGGDGSHAAALAKHGLSPIHRSSASSGLDVSGIGSTDTTRSDGAGMTQPEDMTKFEQMSAQRDEFLQWRRANPQGFVLNAKTTKDFMLHRASCNALEVVTEVALSNPKYCSTDRSVLLKFAESRAVVVASCQACAPGRV